MNTRKRTPASAGTADKGGNIFDPISSLSQNYKPIKGKSLFIRVPEACELLQVSRSTAQRIFRQVNKRLAAAGKFTASGMTNRAAFYDLIGYELIQGENDE